MRYFGSYNRNSKFLCFCVSIKSGFSEGLFNEGKDIMMYQQARDEEIERRKAAKLEVDSDTHVGLWLLCHPDNSVAVGKYMKFMFAYALQHKLSDSWCMHNKNLRNCKKVVFWRKKKLALGFRESLIHWKIMYHSLQPCSIRCIVWLRISYWKLLMMISFHGWGRLFDAILPTLCHVVKPCLFVRSEIKRQSVYETLICIQANTIGWSTWKWLERWSWNHSNLPSDAIPRKLFAQQDQCRWASECAFRWHLSDQTFSNQCLQLSSASSVILMKSQPHHILANLYVVFIRRMFVLNSLMLLLRFSSNSRVSYQFSNDFKFFWFSLQPTLLQWRMLFVQCGKSPKTNHLWWDWLSRSSCACVRDQKSFPTSQISK